MTIRDEIKNINIRLKAFGCNFYLEDYRGHLYLRGLINGEQKRKSLRLLSVLGSLPKAEVKIIQYAKHFSEHGTFPNDVQLIPKVRTLVADLEFDYLKENGNQHTWDTCYLSIFSKLPQDVPLNFADVYKVLSDIEYGSRTYEKAFNAFRWMARRLGNEDWLVALDKLRCSAKKKKVKQRDLITDLEIFELYKLVHPRWKWIYGVLATYGLRPHEAIKGKLLEDGSFEVFAGTKTGSRIVYPLHPEWVAAFNLKDRTLPNILNLEILPNPTITTKISGYFFDNRNKLNGLVAVDLRHCYRRRCFEYRISTELASDLMGHSERVDKVIYAKWYGQDTKKSLYQNAIEAYKYKLS